MNNKSEAEPYDVFSVKNTGGSVIGRVFSSKTWSEILFFKIFV